MSQIHYFQRYSQRENVATNNTLLLFSRLYNESIYKFNDFINTLLDDENIGIGVSFSQQERSCKSIPDGIMKQSSFKVAIETKLGSGKNFGEAQLINHFDSFDSEENKVLMALSPTAMGKKLFERIKEQSKEHHVLFLSKTFKDIIDSFRDVLTPYDFILQEIIDDYEEYCISESLIQDNESRIRIIPCGGSLKLNLKYGVYYMPADRNTSDHGYIGVYKDKAVRGVGKIINEITASYSNGILKILEKKNEVNEEQKNRILNIIKETHENIGWDLSRCNHKYIIVEKFYETNYKKISKGGIQGHRYKNLKEILGIDSLSEVKEIAEKLKAKTWE